MDNLEAIQQWFKFQCNGDWEHEYGIKIVTLDNPGWSVSIDLIDTCLENFTIEENFFQNENNWCFIKSDGKIFSASGDFNKLTLLLDKFINSFALPNILKSNCIYTLYVEIKSFSDIKIFRPIEAKMYNFIGFEITNILEFNNKDIKVFEVNDFEKIDFDTINYEIKYSIGDIVKVDSVTFFDGQGLIIS